MSSLYWLVAVLLLVGGSLTAAEVTDNEAELLAAKQQAAELMTQRDAALQKLQAAESAKTKAVQAAESSKKSVDELSLKIKQLQADLAKEAGKAEELQTQLAKGDLSAISCTQENERLKADISTLGEANAASLRQYHSCKESEQSLLSQLELSASKIHALEHEIGQAEQQAGKAVQECTTAIAEKVKSLEIELKEAQDLTGRFENQSSTLQQKVVELEADASKKQQQLSALHSNLNAVESSLATTKYSLAKAQAAIATGDELQQLMRQAQDAWLPLWTQFRLMQAQKQIVAFLEDLKGGKHGPMGSKVHSFLDVANQHATKAFLLMKPHMDKGYAAASLHVGKAYAAAKPHVDDGLARLSVVLDKARVGLDAGWTKYVTDAEWLHEAKASYVKVEKELIREVSNKMQEITALKPYSDPVTVQLLVYAIFLVPVLVIFVPLLALGCSRSGSAKDVHKRKQDKAKPATQGHPKRHKRA